MPRFLGQHFLVNPAVAEKIVGYLELKNSETVIEIGSGGGALTRPLLKKAEKNNATVIAIEKDEELVGDLKKSLPNSKRLKIIHGDILKVLPRLSKEFLVYKLVGNIPYYLTGYLLRTIGELEYKPTVTILTVQKEVAERIIAKAPDFNLLSASVQVWATATLRETLPKTYFDPPPKVASAIIELGTRTKVLSENLPAYYRLVRGIFKQPRKTIFNNLRAHCTVSQEKLKEILGKEGLAPDLRPQNLTLEMLISLSAYF